MKTFKKVICLFLAVFMSVAFMSGCTLIVHNDEKDAKQIIATISGITDTYKGESFTLDKKVIYKSDLINAMNQKANEMLQNGASLKDVTEQLLEELITQNLVLLEAERLEKKHELKWGQYQINQYYEGIYDTINSQLKSIQITILDERDEKPTDNKITDPAKPTYPLSPTETSTEDNKYYRLDENGNIVYQKNEKGEFKYEMATEGTKDSLKDAEGFLLDNDGNRIKMPVVIEWQPPRSDYPGLWGNEDTKSLERESVRRFIQLIKDIVEKDFKVTADDKAKFAADDKLIADTISTKGIEEVYPILGKTHYMEYLAGVNMRQNIMVTQLQNYITKGVSVTEEEVTKAYNSMVDDQKASYTASPSAYDTAVTEGKTTIVYPLNTNYFYVKHILLPFSDEQTARLKAFKADPTNANKDFVAWRKQLVNETVVYPHVNGENDLNAKTTVDAVFSEIRSEMASLSLVPKTAERKFDELIYKYNTDPGVFGKSMGYAVKTTLAEGEKGAYMEEFEAGARELNKNYEVGQVLDNYVITDYGVHIMYLASRVIPGQIAINAYETPGEYKKIYDVFEGNIQSAKESAAFESWKNERIDYYDNNQNVVTRYPKRIKSLYKD